MQLRRLNGRGLEQFENYIASLSSNPLYDPPLSLLEDDLLSEHIMYEAAVKPREFENRFELARYLHALLTSETGAPILDDIEFDKGLWAWLSLFFFEQLCTKDKAGRRKPGELARWIPEVRNARKYYRHLLAGPYRVYHAHLQDPECTRVVLLNPPDKPGELAEQLYSRQEIITNPELLKLAGMLYMDASGAYKRGAAGSGRGSARRLAQILCQYDVTWDLYIMSANQLKSLLPDEFLRFLA